MSIRISIILVTGFLMGCAQNLNYETGSAVAAMQDQMIYDRVNARNPPSGVVEAVDGEASENTINSYRKVNTEAKTNTVSESVVFSGSEGD